MDITTHLVIPQEIEALQVNPDYNDSDACAKYSELNLIYHYDDDNKLIAVGEEGLIMFPDNRKQNIMPCLRWRQVMLASLRNHNVVHFSALHDRNQSIRLYAAYLIEDESIFWEIFDHMPSDEQILAIDGKLSEETYSITPITTGPIFSRGMLLKIVHSGRYCDRVRAKAFNAMQLNSTSASMELEQIMEDDCMFALYSMYGGHDLRGSTKNYFRKKYPQFADI